MSSDRLGLLRRKLTRLTSSNEELDAADLQAGCLGTGATPIASAPDRCRVSLAGTLRSVTLQPRAGVPALEAELYDGSGTVSIIWLGRRRIPGITCGRSLVATGLVSSDSGRRVMFNPSYQLTSAADE